MAQAPTGKMKRGVGKERGDYSKEGMIEYEEVDIPEAKGNEVLIQVKAAALNIIDIKRVRDGAGCQRFPVYPLADISGIVVAKGPKCTGPLKIGDEVVSCKYPPAPPFQGLAEYFVAAENMVGPKPDGWSFAQGAALPMGMLTAQRVVEKAALTSKTKAVVIGASGNVGAYVLVLNRAIGASILAVASGAKANYCKEMGGPTVTTCDYKTEDWSQKFDKGNPPDVVMDLSAVSPIDAYYKAIALGAKSFVTINPRKPDWVLSCCCVCSECCWMCRIKCCAMLCCRTKYGLAMMNAQKGAGVYQNCAELAAKGHLQPMPLESFPPKQVHMAYGAMQNAGTKTVIDLSSGIVAESE